MGTKEKNGREKERNREERVKGKKRNIREKPRKYEKKEGDRLKMLIKKLPIGSKLIRNSFQFTVTVWGLRNILNYRYRLMLSNTQCPSDAPRCPQTSPKARKLSQVDPGRT